MSDKPVKGANKRGAARLAAVQALYQMDLGGTTLQETLGQFGGRLRGGEFEGDDYLPSDSDYFQQIIAGVVDNQVKIDPTIDNALTPDWPVTRIDATLRAVLRAGTFELMFKKDTPVGVVISEYLDVARAFFEDGEPAMVNAVLDTIAKSVRSE